MRRAIAKIGVLAALVLSSLQLAVADDPLPSDVSFNLRRSFLGKLMTEGPNGRTVGARWSATLRMGEHSRVHGIGDDCEIHVAARAQSGGTIANPGGLVVEPPNVCKKRGPQISQQGSIAKAWEEYFTNKVTGQICEVVGFPRIFTEHSSGGGGGGSNPDHVVEIHPAVSLSCSGDTIDFSKFLHVYPGMRRISEQSATACLEERRLWVRQRGSGNAVRYEFLEQGAKGNAGRCGNFVVVDAHIGKEYLRTLDNGGDHVALAQVWIGESGPYPLKVYTYKGTHEDDAVVALMQDAEESASIEIELHGLLTYDYFTIAQAIQDEHFDWLPAQSLKDYKEVSHPLALVVFGRVAS